MKILLIEDDKKKIEDVRQFVLSIDSTYTVLVKESYQSGLRQLLTEDYDLLLLDMSMPTWDKPLTGHVSHFEKFGGYMIMKELSRNKKHINTILITMFDDFGEADSSLTLSKLNVKLLEEFSDFYISYVYYNSQESDWQEKLLKLIKQVLI